MIRWSSRTQPVGDVAEPTLAIVVQGAKRTVLGDRAFAYGAGDYLVASIELPVTGSITEADPDRPFLAFVLQPRPGRADHLR